LKPHTIENTVQDPGELTRYGNLSFCAKNNLILLIYLILKKYEIKNDQKCTTFEFALKKI